MTLAQPGLAAGLCHTDEDERALAELLTPVERMAYHTKRLRIIQHHQGADGVRAYKQRHPEAAAHRVISNPIAYYPPPKGYDASLLGLAEQWLTDDEALAKSNKADVEELNAKLGAARFNPANHFSKPLSPSRLAKLKAVFLEHGLHLDTNQHNTLSKVKAVAKAAKGSQSADRPFAHIGSVSGNFLTVGDRRISIGRHHDRDSIRVTVDGARLWLRLDVLEAAIGLLLGGTEAEVDPLITTTCSIGELDPNPGNADFDPLADDELGELVPVSHGLPIGELDPISTDPPSLGERIAALKAVITPHSTTCPEGIDPLAL